MPRETRLKSGCVQLDEATEGGLKAGEIVHIYGPSGAGKTTLAMQYTFHAALRKFRIVYISIDTAFSLNRFKQIASNDFDVVAPRVYVTSPKGFSQQEEFLDNFDTIIPHNTQLLVVDTIVSLYRKELGDFDKNIVLSRLLNRQLGLIASIGSRHNLAVILLNQVRGDDDNPDGFCPMANSIISFWCTTTIRIKKAESKGHREFQILTRKSSTPIEFKAKLTDFGFR
jgi:RecA/RadA recombinase